MLQLERKGLRYGRIFKDRLPVCFGDLHVRKEYSLRLKTGISLV